MKNTTFLSRRSQPVTGDRVTRTVRSVVLSDRLLAEHRAGAVLCLAASARGASFALPSELVATALIPARKAQASRVGIPGPGLDDDDDDRNESDEGDDDEDAPPSSRDTSGPMVAVVSVRGPLTSEVTPWTCGMTDGYTGDGGIVERMAAALTDPRVAAVVMDVMSPGGDSVGVGEAAQMLAEMRASCGKPVLAFVRQACSAAYWLASSAAEAGGLFAAESADVGNVGCWTMHVDQSKANEADGLAVTYVADPPGKVAGNPDEPLSAEAKARLQRGVSEVRARFCAAVSASRPGLTADALLALDGDTRRGSDAVAMGLADGVARSLGDVVSLAYARAVAAKPPSVLMSGGMQAMRGGLPHLPESQEMGYSQHVLALVGLAAGVSDAAAEAAILPRLALAARALELLGETDVERAKGKLAARLEEAATVTKDADELRAENESFRRAELVANAVSSGRLAPRAAYRFRESVDGTRERVLAPELAKMSSAELEGYLEGLPALARDRAVTDVIPAEVPDRDGALPPRWAALAKKQGRDPAVLAENVQRLFGRRAAAEE